MLYTLSKLLLSSGLGGDGDLGDRPRCIDLMPLLSMLVFLSGSLFSALRLSKLGRRFDATEGLRESSRREVLRMWFSERSFRGMVSAKLGSVSSRMSDRGRILAQEDALMDCPLGSLELPPTIPPHPNIWVLSVSGDVRNDAPLALANEEPGWCPVSVPGGGCE